MNHYVYRTKRGLLRTVQASGGCAAWRLAEKRHAVESVHDLTGATWRWSEAIPGPHRDEGVYITPEAAKTLYLDACDAEMPFARTLLASVGEVHAADLAAGLLRMCETRGLVAPDATLTDLGRAFAARFGGAK